jgi:hypothetical protein
VFEPEDCVIVMTSYPVEKEYPESTWFAFRRLLDNPELVEVFNESTLEIEQTEAATGLSGMYAKLELQRDTVQKRFEAETLITSRLYKQLQQFKTALNDMMVGQEFDGGGHVIKRIAPPHSAVIKSKMLLGVAASKK